MYLCTYRRGRMSRRRDVTKAFISDLRDLSVRRPPRPHWLHLRENLLFAIKPLIVFVVSVPPSVRPSVRHAARRRKHCSESASTWREKGVTDLAQEFGCNIVARMCIFRPRPSHLFLQLLILLPMIWLLVMYKWFQNV